MGVILCGNVAVLCQPQWRRIDRVAAIDMGLVRKAIAFRVKYRVSLSKKRIALPRWAVHPQNRGGMYPQPDTVRNLGVQIMAAGFNGSEADHEGVCEEDVPFCERSSSHSRSGGLPDESYAE